MGNEALDWLMSAGVPSAAFDNPGTVIKGVILVYEKRQQTDFTTREPLFYKDGSPRWQLVITLQTDEHDPSIEDDDGKRKLYAKGEMLTAIRQAIRKAGHKGEIRGGELAVKFTGFETPAPRGLQPKKLYAAKFVPGPAIDEFEAAHPAETAPAPEPVYADDEEPF